MITLTGSEALPSLEHSRTERILTRSEEWLQYRRCNLGHVELDRTSTAPGEKTCSNEVEASMLPSTRRFKPTPHPATSNTPNFGEKPLLSAKYHRLLCQRALPAAFSVRVSNCCRIPMITARHNPLPPQDVKNMFSKIQPITCDRATNMTTRYHSEGR